MNRKVCRQEILGSGDVPNAKGPGTHPGFDHGWKSHSTCPYFPRASKEGGSWTGNPLSHGELQQFSFISDELDLIVWGYGEKSEAIEEVPVPC